MHNTSRGLAGKARREHQRSRAMRLYTDQMIAEYEGLPESPDVVIVPIRRRGEFLPTAPEYVGATDPSESGAGMQLDLPLVGTVLGDRASEGPAAEPATRPYAGPITCDAHDAARGRNGKEAIAMTQRAARGDRESAGTPATTRDSEQAWPASAEASVNGSPERSTGAAPGPVRRRALGLKTMSRPPVGWSSDRAVETSTRPFSVRGFVYGCAIGGAAAAVALLVCRSLLGL